MFDKLKTIWKNLLERQKKLTSKIESESGTNQTSDSSREKITDKSNEQDLGKQDKQQIADISDKIKSKARNSLASTLTSANTSKKAKRQQDLIIMGILAVILIVLIIWLRYKNQPVIELDEDGNKPAIKLEVASKALDSEKMWRNYFEEKLIDNKKQSSDKLKLIEDSLNEQSNAYQAQLKSEIDKLKAQMRYLAEEQKSSNLKLNNINQVSREKEEPELRKRQSIDTARINVNDMDRGEYFDRPKSARNFIPETAYVKGVMLGGISVSTAMGSSAEPVPVVIRIKNRGNLPKNFNIDLEQCQIMGSAYGDLSSERAIIRAEVMSCRDIENELIHTTKISGVIYGDDGFNGIKGKVVQTSSKHLKNAMVGSMISGFASAGKGQEQFSVSNIGITSKKKTMKDMAQDGTFAGVSNASEKLADYYIKQAESMSPILLVSGGTKVDVVFTKGVYLGALDIEEKLNAVRASQKVRSR
ncbi:MAG: TrbI/VirB10 family protein [Pseudomonadota bacterium]